MLDYRYNDQPLAELTVPGKDQTTSVIKRFSELLILSLALGHYEERVSIDDRIDGKSGMQETPNFFVTLSDKRIIGTEVSRLTDPSRTATANLIEKLSEPLGLELSERRELSEAVTPPSHLPYGYLLRTLAASAPER